MNGSYGKFPNYANQVIYEYGPFSQMIADHLPGNIKPDFKLWIQGLAPG